MVLFYLSRFIELLAQLLIFAISARVILTWLRVVPRGLLFTLFVETTEPILGPLRRVVPPVGGVLDISPLVAFFLIVLIRNILLSVFTAGL